MQESESEHRFTKLQAISISLIQTDLRFIFTAVKNSERFKSNYWVSLMPYIGVVVDGAEDYLLSVYKGNDVLKEYNNKSASGNLSLNVTGLEEGTYYNYSVKAANGNSVGEASDRISVRNPVSPPPVTCGDSPVGACGSASLRRHLRCFGSLAGNLADAPVRP